MNKLSKINFTFTANGINPALLRDYIAKSQRDLCECFELPADAVRVVHKKRLPDDAPFSLGCYGLNGKPDYDAFPRAARILLPSLRLLAAESMGIHSYVHETWSPGESLAADLAASELIAKGYHRTTEGADHLALDKREWLERTAQSCGALVNSVDNFSNEELAHIVHVELSARVQALAGEALIACHVTVGQLPFVIKQVAYSDGTLDVTGSLLLNTHKSADRALGQYGGKVA